MDIIIFNVNITKTVEITAEVKTVETKEAQIKKSLIIEVEL